MRRTTLLLLLAMIGKVDGFLLVVHRRSSSNTASRPISAPLAWSCAARGVAANTAAAIALRATGGGGGGDEDEKLSSLGYSEQEIQRSRSSSSSTGYNNKKDIKVNVSLLPEVDAVTLTAVGFSLIAANFFIFANMGDGGIAGVVDSIINLSRQ